MREIRSSGSVEGVVSNHDSYSDSIRFPKSESLEARESRLRQAMVSFQEKF